MSGLLKDKDLGLVPGIRLHRLLGRKAMKDKGDGQQKGAPGFTTFQKPSQGVKSPLGG